MSLTSVTRRGKPRSFALWLRKLKGASMLVVQTPAGEKKVPLDPQRGGSRVFAYAARTVIGLQGTSVEALDAEGNTLGVFEIPDPDGDADIEGELPGYTPDPGDSDEVALLKTFAHLLSDAHKQANKQLVDTVGLITGHFTEDRANARKTIEAQERAMSRLARGSRVRVATGDEEEDPDGEVMDGIFKDFLRNRGAAVLEDMIGGAGKNGASGPAKPDGGTNGASS